MTASEKKIPAMMFALAEAGFDRVSIRPQEVVTDKNRQRWHRYELMIKARG